MWLHRLQRIYTYFLDGIAQRFTFVNRDMANADRLRRIFCIYPTPTIVFLLGFGLCSGEFYWISLLTAGEIRGSPAHNEIPNMGEMRSSVVSGT